MADTTKSWRLAAQDVLEADGVCGALVCTKSIDGDLRFHWGAELSDHDVALLMVLINDAVASKYRQKLNG